MQKNKTRKTDTFGVLDAHFYNGKDVCVNWERINDTLITNIDNVKVIYDYAINKRSKATSVAWYAFMYSTKDLLILGDYNGSNCVTSAQLKAYMAREKVGYEVLQPTVDYVLRLRQDYDK